MGNAQSAQSDDKTNALDHVNDFKQLNNLVFLKNLCKEPKGTPEVLLDRTLKNTINSRDLVDIYSTSQNDETLSDTASIVDAATTWAKMRPLFTARESVLNLMLDDVVNKLAAHESENKCIDGKEKSFNAWNLCEGIQLPKSCSHELSAWHFLFASTVAVFSSTMVGLDESRRGNSLERLSLSLIKVLDLSKK